MAKDINLDVGNLDLKIPRKKGMVPPTERREDIAFGISNIQMQLAQVIADISNYVEVCAPHMESLQMNIERVRNVLDRMNDVNPNIHPVKYSTLQQWRVDLAVCVNSLGEIYKIMSEEFEKIRKEKNTQLQS